MAKMIPATLSPTTKSAAEKRLFEVFRDGLDDSFMVFHSFDLLAENRQGRFIDGEIDFLIFHSDFGLLVIEVKGGVIAYDGEQGIWYQNSKPIKSPFAQAEDSKYKLGGFLKKRFGRDAPFSIAHAVCFPDVYSDLTGLPSGADSGICIAGNQLRQIGETLTGILTAARSPNHGPVAEEDVSILRQALMPHCEFGSSLSDRMGQTDEVLFRLTEEQCKLLDFIGLHRQALIEGCAGSGKTIMAVKKARQLAAEGKTVLLLAFNLLIGDHLAASVRDLQNVTATNYHTFCMDCLKEAGELPDPTGRPDYWQRDVPEGFAMLMKRQPLKYDAVIVDEGQDFRLEYWLTVTDMVKEQGHFYIFYDPDQNLYGNPLEFPISGPPFLLKANCRNSETIFHRIEKYATGPMQLNPEMPGGEPIVELHIPDASFRRKQLGKIVHDLVVNKGMPIESIVVLGGHSMNHTCIGDKPGVGMFRLSETGETGPNVVQYHTYMKYKGCESDVVIMIDVSPKDDRWTDQGLYTTVSRAKHLLFILYSDGVNNAR